MSNNWGRYFCLSLSTGCLFLKTRKPHKSSPSSDIPTLSSKGTRIATKWMQKQKGISRQKRAICQWICHKEVNPQCAHGLLSGLRVSWLTQPYPEVLFAPQFDIFLSFWEMIIVFHIWNSSHLCLASFAILRVARGTILKWMCFVFYSWEKGEGKPGPSIFQTYPPFRARSRRICC